MLRTIRRRALRQGLLGGSRTWQVVWAVLLGARLLRRLTRVRPEVVYSEKLEPGETLVITAGDREPRLLGG